MRKLRIAAISFLNTAPLMWDFEHTELGREFDIISTVPSECAEMLRSGAADIGIVPVVAYTTIPDLRVIPQVAIATKGSEEMKFEADKVLVSVGRRPRMSRIRWYSSSLRPSS